MNFRAILKGFLTAVIGTLAVFLAVTVLEYFGTLDPKMAMVVVYVLSGISVAIGSVVTARISDSKILINCMLTALFYIVMLVILSVAINGSLMLSPVFLLLILGTLVCSFVGAVVGK